MSNPKEKIQNFIRSSIVTILRHQPSAADEEFELEIRYQNTTSANYNLLLNHFKSLPLPTFYDETIDFYHANGVRVTKWPRSNKEVVIRKETKSQLFLFEQQLKLSLSSEKKLIRSPSFSSPHLVRRKLRTSFVMQNLLFQLTRLVQDHSANVNYEVEIEIWDPTRPYTLARLQYFMEMLETITSPKSTLETKFNGALPTTLTVPSLTRLENEPFAVTLKMDGIRAIVDISEEGDLKCKGRDGVLLYSPPFEIESKWNPQCPFVHSTFDAEWDPHTHVFHIYDTLMIQGLDCRDDKNSMILRKRLEVAHQFVEFAGAPFTLKPFYFAEQWATWPLLTTWAKTFGPLDCLEEDTKMKSDGLIFTKEDTVYPKHIRTESILKWKPRHLQSIDFRIMKNHSPYHHTVSWTLLVQFKDRVGPFPPCPSIQLAKEVSDQYQHASIVECVYQNDVSAFMPFRARPEKTTPNFITTAEDVWAAITHPITPLMFSDTKPENTKWLILRRAHGQMKRRLIHTVCDQMSLVGIHVLDIACGRGGDLHSLKSFASSIANYTGSDINSTNLQEAVSRYKMQTFPHQFFEADWRHIIPQKIKEPANVVLVQFAIHFFFETPESWANFIQNVNQNTCSGALLVCTTFDALQVLALLKGRKKLERFHDNGANYKLELGIPSSNDEFGSKLKVGMFGDQETLLKETNTEYLVHMAHLVYLFKLSGWSLINTELFDCEELQSDEFFYTFSRLNRSYIFKKI